MLSTYKESCSLSSVSTGGIWKRCPCFLLVQTRTWSSDKATDALLLLKAHVLPGHRYQTQCWSVVHYLLLSSNSLFCRRLFTFLFWVKRQAACTRRLPNMAMVPPPWMMHFRFYVVYMVETLHCDRLPSLTNTACGQLHWRKAGWQNAEQS